MRIEVIISVVFISLALVFYSFGVWSERFAGRLHVWHLGFFWGGLVCDTLGTGMMMEMSAGISFNIHGITGLLAILLMLVHAAWATVVLVRRDEAAITTFHRYSIVVWSIWMVPYCTGFFASMR